MQMHRLIFQTAARRFVAGGDSPEAVARRNGSFKLIPHIVQGSWIVKQSVGETPVLLGRKLTTQYFKCVHCRAALSSPGNSLQEAGASAAWATLTASLPRLCKASPAGPQLDRQV